MKLPLKKKPVKKRSLPFTPLHYLIIIFFMFVLIFVISFVLFTINKGTQQRIVLFFPNTSDAKLVGEERYIKRQSSPINNMKALVSELLLGPSLPGSSPLFPRKTKMISVILIKNHLYINFSKEIIFSDIKTPLDFYSSLYACINSMRYNFPQVKYISFFVNGKVVEFTDESGTGEILGYTKSKFRKDLLK
jgi:spore germination protein GerM